MLRRWLCRRGHIGLVRGRVDGRCVARDTVVVYSVIGDFTLLGVRGGVEWCAVSTAEYSLETVAIEISDASHGSKRQGRERPT